MRHHLSCAVGAGLVVALALGLLPGDTRTRVSMGLAYAAMLALAVTLSLGTVNLLRRRPNPVSADLRRDIGLWAAFLAIGHTAVGLTVHFRGTMALYFLAPPEQRLPGPVRLDPFGLANHLGLAAALLLAGLALISSDAALARLGTHRWKRWQRLAYPLAVLTMLHGVVYQLLESRGAALVGLFAGLGLLILAAQGIGFRQVRSAPHRSERSP